LDENFSRLVIHVLTRSVTPAAIRSLGLQPAWLT
jgi:hypothetical protein